MHRDPTRRLASTLGYAFSRAADLVAAVLLAGHAIAGATDWVPAKDQDLDAFCTNWDTLITAAPGTYALQASDATAFHTARLDFTTKLALAVNPSTSTKSTVQDKDTSKANLKTLLRQQAAIVQASPAVTDVSRQNLGLPVHQETPAPIPTPVTVPLLNLTGQGVRTLQLRYSDQLTPDSPRKPDGAVAMELYVSVSATPIVDQDAVTYRGLATRNPVEISFEAGDVTKTAYICGRWVTGTGEVGPWSDMLSRTVAA